MPFWSIRTWENFVSTEAIKVEQNEKPPYWCFVAYWRHFCNGWGKWFGL